MMCSAGSGMDMGCRDRLCGSKSLLPHLRMDGVSVVRRQSEVMGEDSIDLGRTSHQTVYWGVETICLAGVERGC